MNSSACTSRCALPTAGTAAFSRVTLLWWLSTTAMRLSCSQRTSSASSQSNWSWGTAPSAPDHLVARVEAEQPDHRARRRRSTRCARCSRLSGVKPCPTGPGTAGLSRWIAHEVGLVEQLARRVRRHGAQPGRARVVRDPRLQHPLERARLRAEPGEEVGAERLPRHRLRVADRARAQRADTGSVPSRACRGCRRRRTRERGAPATTTGVLTAAVSKPGQPRGSRSRRTGRRSDRPGGRPTSPPPRPARPRRRPAPRCWPRRSRRRAMSMYQRSSRCECMSALSPVTIAALIGAPVTGLVRAAAIDSTIDAVTCTVSGSCGRIAPTPEPSGPARHRLEARRRLRVDHVHVGEVAEVGQRPPAGLARAAGARPRTSRRTTYGSPGFSTRVR